MLQAQDNLPKQLCLTSSEELKMLSVLWQQDAAEYYFSEAVLLISIS